MLGKNSSDVLGFIVNNHVCAHGFHVIQLLLGAGRCNYFELWMLQLDELNKEASRE